jgi:bilin biosynthesis protein
MDNPVLDIQAANDILIQDVNDQISLGTFDSSDRKILGQLVEGLGDPRGLVRLRFAETIGDIGEIVTPFLTEALANHPNVVLRRAAAKTLTIIADPSAVPNLLQSFLNDPDTVVRSSSAGALARTGEASALALLGILESSDQPQDIKGQAAWALAFIGADAAEHLYKALNSESIDVRCAVIGAIGHVAQEQLDEKSCNILISALTDPEPIIRTEATAAFGQVNYPEAIPHLILALKDAELGVRKAAINALGKIGDTNVISYLQPLLNDEQEVLRVLAKLAIAQINRQAQE